MLPPSIGASFDHALSLRSPGCTRPKRIAGFFRELAFAACELWGWFDKQNLVGIIAFREGWTDQLCVLPSAQGRGIGTARLEVARSRFPRFGLWTFQRNANACRFYERHDFTLVRETDGSANEKKEPDALYERSSGR